ncbi:hypothetical protein SHIRM173S_06200 [Streptomyces hirsutus]
MSSANSPISGDGDGDTEDRALEPPYEGDRELRITGGQPGQQSLVRETANGNRKLGTGHRRSAPTKGLPGRYGRSHSHSAPVSPGPHELLAARSVTVLCQPRQVIRQGLTPWSDPEHCCRSDLPPMTVEARDEAPHDRGVITSPPGWLLSQLPHVTRCPDCGYTFHGRRTGTQAARPAGRAGRAARRPGAATAAEDRELTATWQHIKAIAARHGDRDAHEADLADALDQLMRRAHAGTATPGEQRLFTRTTPLKTPPAAAGTRSSISQRDSALPRDRTSSRGEPAGERSPSTRCRHIGTFNGGILAGEVETSPADFTQEHITHDISTNAGIGADIHLMAAIHPISAANQRSETARSQATTWSSVRPPLQICNSYHCSHGEDQGPACSALWAKEWETLIPAHTGLSRLGVKPALEPAQAPTAPHATKSPSKARQVYQRGLDKPSPSGWSGVAAGSGTPSTAWAARAPSASPVRSVRQAVRPGLPPAGSSRVPMARGGRPPEAGYRTVRHNGLDLERAPDGGGTAYPTNPQIVLGTMDFGTRVAPERAFAILDSFVAGGNIRGSTPRTAAPSGAAHGVGGSSERLIGAWLRARPARATRCG